MRPIRAFLFSRSQTGQWICQVFRDFEPLYEAAMSANDGGRHPVAIHVGFQRPETELVADVLSTAPGFVFLSSGAIGTMPSPIRASHLSIGSAGDSAFHTALDGFGYTIEECGPFPVTPEASSEQPLSQNTVATGWVASLVNSNPNLLESLKAASIFDDETYRLHEANLDVDTRYLAGVHRYHTLVGKYPEARSILDNLEFSPPWLLASSVDLLDLSVRAQHVCAAHDIKTVEDVSWRGYNGLCKLPNLGLKSVHEISEKIVLLFITGRALGTFTQSLTPNVPRQSSEEPPARSANSAAHSSADEQGDCETPVYSCPNILDGFEQVAARLTQKERRVWTGRIGFRCELLTLQQIADQLGVTRERVRQIEAKVYQRVQGHPFWGELSERLEGLLRGRTAPLFLNGISAVDPWFVGAEELVDPLREVFEHISRIGFHVLIWNDLPVVSRMRHDEWLQAMIDAKGILMEISRHGLPERDALLHATSALKAQDMREALQEEVSEFCIWSEQPDGSRILAGVGKSAAALVSGVLQASDMPLHIDEIQRRLRRHSTYEATNAPNIRRAAAEVGMLFGRGTYGLLKHCPLDESQMVAVRAEVEDIVSGGSPSKQWHSNELYDELLNRGFSYDGKLTKYIINIALADSPTLVYLRRMVWGLRGEWSEGAGARLDVKQAVVSLLETEGRPMSTAQIRSKLMEGRGLNVHFQIWASSPLVRLGPGIWGLQGRDVDMESARSLAERLHSELAARQSGMHVTEVADFLGLASEDEVSTLVSISGEDGLRMDKGQYCYLQPWGGSRRISILDAAVATLKAHPEGLTLAGLHEFVEEIVKRRVARQQLSGIPRWPPKFPRVWPPQIPPPDHGVMTR